jgi:hypothetical protein
MLKALIGTGFALIGDGLIFARCGRSAGLVALRDGQVARATPNWGIIAGFRRISSDNVAGRRKSKTNGTDGTNRTNGVIKVCVARVPSLIVGYLLLGSGGCLGGVTCSGCGTFAFGVTCFRRFVPDNAG